MALLLKARTEREKGIIVFTHKEIDLFEKPIRHEKRVLDRLERLRSGFLFGVHIGGSMPEYPVFDPLDFYMAPESTRFIKRTQLLGKNLFSRPADAYHIPLCARSFLPADFGLEECPKLFDIIMIARAVKNKYPDEFIKAVKRIYSSGKRYKVLLIAADTYGESGVDVAELYYSTFTPDERDLFSLMYMSSRMSQFPLPSATISFLLRASKVCALFSMAEGDSRNVHEALMAGLPIVLSHKMTGGARDYLDESNSVQFGDFPESHEALIRAVEEYPRFKGIRAKIEPLCSEAHSIPRLENYLAALCGKLGQPYTPGQLRTHQLSLTLAAHTRERTPGQLTLDLDTPEKVLAWLQEVAG